MRSSCGEMGGTKADTVAREVADDANDERKQAVACAEAPEGGDERRRAPAPPPPPEAAPPSAAEPVAAAPPPPPPPAAPGRRPVVAEPGFLRCDGGLGGGFQRRWVKAPASAPSSSLSGTSCRKG